MENGAQNQKKYYPLKNKRRFNSWGPEIRLEIELGHILTSRDFELGPIKLNLFSSDNRTINLHFDGLSVAVG